MTTPLNADDPRRLGAYELVGRLGEGGMGVTFLATTVRGLPVAVKTVRGGSGELAARFRREAEATRLVESAWIASVVDVQMEHDPPLLITEYVPGETLRRRVEREGPLPEAELRELADALAGALADLEGHGVVHRDITPANVMLSSYGPRLIDLGIAVVEDATRMTEVGTSIGTVAWMSPEQLTGRDIGPWIDWWSTGAVLVYAATGRSPFGDGPTEAVTYRIERGRADLESVPGWLRARLEGVFEVDRSRRRRPELDPGSEQTVHSERLRDTTAVMADEATRPYPPPAPVEATRRQETFVTPSHDDRLEDSARVAGTPARKPRFGLWALTTAIVSMVSLVAGFFQDESLTLIYLAMLLLLVAAGLLVASLVARRYR